MKCTTVFVQERFCWGTLLQDGGNWVKNHQCCETTKGPYIGPEPPQGPIVVDNPMDLLCLDFMNMDPIKNGKEQIFIMTDAFFI